MKLVIAFALTLAGLSASAASVTPSTQCGTAAMDAIVRDIVKKLAKPSDIDDFEGELAGSADLTETTKDSSTYEAYFTQPDRYHVDYKVTVGENCKILNIEAEGYY